MNTKIHTYSFNLADPTQREPYHQLQCKLAAEVTLGKRGYCMNCMAGFGENARNHDEMVKDAEIAGSLTLEPEYLFENQWNTTEAGRVFDWYEGINFNNRLLKFGHYLEITPEMEQIRRETLKCGYTGQQFPHDCGLAFNITDQALGSPYLKESQLSMLRLLPVWPACERREPLTAEESEYLLPLYIAAQTRTNAKAREKQRADVEADFITDSRKAETEYRGKLWLLDNGVNLENAIFYNHTERFCFGWRNPYGKKAAEAMRKALAAFPFAFDIKEESHA